LSAISRERYHRMHESRAHKEGVRVAGMRATTSLLVTPRQEGRRDEATEKVPSPGSAWPPGVKPVPPAPLNGRAKTAWMLETGTVKRLWCEHKTGTDLLESALDVTVKGFHLMRCFGAGPPYSVVFRL
jgi:hypothetical protein